MAKTLISRKKRQLKTSFGMMRNQNLQKISKREISVRNKKAPVEENFSQLNMKSKLLTSLRRAVSKCSSRKVNTTIRVADLTTDKVMRTTYQKHKSNKDLKTGHFLKES